MYTIKRYFYKILALSFVLFFFIIALYPVLWMFLGSLKDSNDFYSNIWGVPIFFNWENYSVAWEKGIMGQKFLNSIIVTLSSLFILIPINSCAAYAIGRLHFKLKKMIYMYLLSGIMIPVGVLGIPTFTIALYFNLNNTLLGLILIYVAQAIAMGVFIMRAFFISLPNELEEAAMIDGCTRFRSFLFVILPLTKAGIMTQIIFNGLSIWNEYFMANIMLNENNKFTLPLAVANFIGQRTTNYPQLFASLSISTIPIIVVFIFSQKSFIEGVSAGAVKG